MHAELLRDLTDANQTAGFYACRRHNLPEALQVPSDTAWACWTISPTAQA
jgi:hypothetical protein